MTLNLSRTNVQKLSETTHNIDVGRLYDLWFEIEEQRATLGGLTIQPSSDSITAFLVNQADGTGVFNVDTTNARVGINDTSPASSLEVNGDTRLGDGTNYSEFETDGTLEFVGNATVWDDLRIPGLAVTTGAAGQPDLEAFLGAGDLLAYAFTGTGAITEQVYFTIQLPHSYKEGTDITPHVHWSPTTTASGSVVWQLEYTWANIDGTFGASATISVIDAADEVAWKHQMATFSAITGTSKTISSMLVCRLFRDPTDGDDNYEADASFLEFDFHFEIDTVGSRQILTK